MSHVSLATPANPRPTDGDAAGGAGDERYRWDLLVTRALHPIQVAIVEAFLYLDCPLSPSELRRVFDKAYTASHISYHVNCLAKFGALELVDEQKARGAIRHVYILKEPGSP